MARKTSRRNFKPKQKKDGEARKRVPVKDTETKPKMSFWRRVLKTLPLMLLALLFTFILNRAGLFAELETTILDTQMKMDLPAEESDVVIVDITQEDFVNKDIFQGETRPLKPIALEKLVEAIAEGQPCVVGIDIDTSFGEFKDFKVSDKLSNFVWSRSAEIPDDVNQKPFPLNVLGRQDSALNEKSGLPITEDDAKGITRFYSRSIETTEGKMPSFAWAVFKEGKSRNCAGIKFPDLEETTESLIIGYSRGAGGAGRTRITAGNILKLAGNPNWQNNELIKGKIVLLGGSYLGEDKHDTPLGVMNGVEINANVIESDLRGGGLKPPGFLSIILLQIFDGVLLITLFQIFAWRKAALLSLPFIIFLSLACSFFTYYSFSYWAFFAPVMIGVVVTELIDKAKDRYKSKITETYQEFSGQPPDEKQNPTAEK